MEKNEQDFASTIGEICPTCFFDEREDNEVKEIDIDIDSLKVIDI